MRWPARNLEERFWPKVNKDGPIHPTLGTRCWLWTAGTNGHGYGAFHPGPGRRGMGKAHRISWTIANGPIPDGLGVLHRCDNPPCVNPAHLFLGTDQENHRDMDAKGRHGRYNARKTHCAHGHEFTPENTGRQRRGRTCKACKYLNTRGSRILKDLNLGEVEPSAPFAEMARAS